MAYKFFLKVIFNTIKREYQYKYLYQVFIFVYKAWKAFFNFKKLPCENLLNNKCLACLCDICQTIV